MHRSSSSSSTIGRHRDYDAVVVGARPAGASTAMLLARAGRRVLLVDRAEYGDDTLSTHALMRAGVVQLHRWGLLDEIRRAGTPAIRRTRFHYADEVVDIELREQAGVDALYAPRRTVLDRVLVDAARRAGVETAFGVRVVGLQRDASGRVNGISAQTPRGHDAVASAPIVIGADGLHSTIAHLVGAPIEYERPGASAFIYGHFAGLGGSAYDWYWRPGVSAGAIPTNDGVSNVFAGLPAARFAGMRRRGVEHVFGTVLAEAAPELAERLRRATPVAGFRIFPGRDGYLRTAAGPGWALVGDAGSYKDPTTAHGITDALRDAELLARAVLETPADAPDASAYQVVRDRLAKPFLDATAAVASFAWSLPEIQAIHMDVKAATDPELDLLAELGPLPEAQPRRSPSSHAYLSLV